MNTPENKTTLPNTLDAGLPDVGQTRVADCFWPGGIGVSISPMRAQASRAVLDALRPAAFGCARRSSRLWPLGWTLAHNL